MFRSTAANRVALLHLPIVCVCQQDHATKEKVLQSMAAMSSAQIVSASAMHNKAMAVGLVGGMLSPSVPIGPTYPSYGSQVNLVHVYASPTRACTRVRTCMLRASVSRTPVPVTALPVGHRGDQSGRDAGGSPLTHIPVCWSCLIIPRRWFAPLPAVRTRRPVTRPSKLWRPCRRRRLSLRPRCITGRRRSHSRCRTSKP